ncbi:uncharacterized protein LOC135489206 isoform X2 [Lineus longissimus]|uniref:uncharacterized protein LOC135489206 isoform X2 n=1 Tax=Lineus longissimus TaxID=88925 RepID=UPI00315C98CB
MTVLDAAYSNTATYGDQLLSSHLKRVLGAVTEDDHDARPGVLTIIAECDRALKRVSSQEICRDLARSAVEVHSDQEAEVPLDKKQLTTREKKTSVRDTKPNKYDKYSKTDFNNVFKQRLRTHIQSLSSVGSSTDIEVNDADTCYAVEFSHKSRKDSPHVQEGESHKEVWKRPVNVCSPLPSFSDSLVDEVCESDLQESPQPLRDSTYSLYRNGVCSDISGIVELSKRDQVSNLSAVKKNDQVVNCDWLKRPGNVNSELRDHDHSEIKDICDSDDDLSKEDVDSSSVSRSAQKYVGDLDHEEEDRLSAFDGSEFSSCDEEELLLLEASLVYDDLVSEESDSKMASPNRKVSRASSAKMPVMAKLRVPGPVRMERTARMEIGNLPLSAGSVTSPFSPTNSLSPGVRSSGSESSYEAVGVGRASRPVRRTEPRLVRSPSLNGDITSPPRMGSPTRGKLMEVMPKQVSKLRDRSSLQRTNSMKDTVNHLLRKYSFTGKNRPNIAKTSLALKERMAAHRRQKQTAVLVEEGSTRPRIRSSSSGSRERPFHRSASDSSIKSKAKTASNVSHSRQSSFEGLSIGVVLRRIGCGLPERELWAVCRECVLTVLDIQAAPCISMDTVIIQDSGHISFIALPDNCDLDPMFLAPEAILGGGLNEKTIVFSIAALLWLAADYNLSENQEPDFTDTFDDLMMSMTHDEPEIRPTLIEVLEKCDAAENERREPSHQLCRILLRDAHNAKNYGRSNSLVQEFMHEEVEQKKEISRAELLEDIKLVATNKTLKPVGERKLAEKPKVENLHDQLMSGIKNEYSRLKPRTKPVEMSVREIYKSNPNLMRGLKRVTVKANDPNKPQQLADVLLSPGQSSSDSLLSPSKIRADLRAALQLLDKKSLTEKQALIVAQSREETVEVEVPPLELCASASECHSGNSAANVSAISNVIDSLETDLPETDLDSLVVNPSDTMTTLPNVNRESSVQLKVSSVDVKPTSSPPESRIPKPKVFTRRNSDSDVNCELFSDKTKKSECQRPSIVKPKPVVSLKPMQKSEENLQDKSQMSYEIMNFSGETIDFQSEPSLPKASDLSASSNSGFTVVSPSSGAHTNSGFSVVSPQGGFVSSSNSGFSIVSPQAGAHPNSGVTVSPQGGLAANSNSGFSAVSKSKNRNVNAPVPNKRSVPAGSIGTQVNNDSKGKGKVPKAFISSATHFTPIVLAAESDFFKQKEAAKQSSSTKKEPEKLSGHYKKNDNATKDRNKLVAEKLKELKKQLSKNQPPAHMVDDLENESSFETGPSGSRSHPNSRVTSPMEVKKCLSPPETELRAAATREVPVPAVRRAPKEKSQQKETVKPKVISPCDKAEDKQKPCQNASGETTAFPRQSDIDFTTVAHLQDPKTGIVYAMIPVTKPVSPQPEKQLPSGTKSGREVQSSKDHHKRHTSTSSDEEESPRHQPRRRRPERRRVAKTDSKEKHQQKTMDTKPEVKRRSRSTCKDSAPLAASEEPNRHVTRGRHSFKSDSSRSRIPLPRERAKSQERLTDIGRQRGERSQYPPVSGKTRPEFKRSVSEKDLNSLRVYGDIDIGTPVGASTDFDNTEITFSAIDTPKGKPPKNGVDPPEQVVPALNSSFEDHEAQFELEEVEIVPQQEEIVHGAMAAISPIMPPSPSPPLSKDSGVSGLILKSNGGAAYPSLMDRLLNSDAMRRHEVLRKVVLLIREEFAFDGYMENGVEDLAMAEWLMSLSNVSWETFCRAVSEKYCDFYWSEELLYSLYDGINGKSPFSRLNTNNAAAPSHIGQNYRVQRMEEQHSSQDSGPSNDAASRAIPSNTLSQKSVYTKNKNRRFISDTSDSTDTEILRTRKRRARRKNNLDKNKSLSAGNLLDVGVDTVCSRPLRSMSQEDLLDHGPKRKSKLTPSRLKKATSQDELSMPRRKEPSNVVMDSTDYFVPTNVIMPDSVSDSTEPTPTLPRFRMKMTESETDSTATSQEVSNFKVPRPIGQAPILRRESSHEWRKPVRRHRPSRDDSMSSQSSTGGAPLRPPSAALTVSSQGSNPIPGSDVPRLNKTSLMCYATEMQGQVHPDIKSMEDQLLHRARGAVEAKIAEIDQQMMLENKMRQKSQKFHRKMMESGKSSKGGVDQRNILNKVSKEITEMTSKLVFLELARRHLEMLYAEQWGIDYSLMSSLVTATLRTSLDLMPKSWIDLIQYQSQKGQDGYVEHQVLHAGTPTGLTVYLFAKESLSGGFIHEFFYCYRYFTTAREVLNFIIDRYTIAVSDPQQTDNHQRIQRRGLDLLQYWVEGFYSLDFKSNQDLIKILDDFVEDKMVKTEKSTESFLHLLEECRDDRHEDFSKAFASRVQDGMNNDAEQASTEPQPNKKWKQVFGKGKNQKNKVILYSSKQKVPDGDANLPNFSRPGDSFSLTDFSSQRLAEQLTLIEQALFRETHPVMFLNSKAVGIGVASLSSTGMRKSSSAGRVKVWDGPIEKSLFVGNESLRNCIQKMIEHGHRLTHWVAAEILCCSSAKVQLNILTKFIYTAKMCLDMRNYATAISIIDALENYIVRQLPVWKTLPSKSVSIMEDLTQVKAYLKKDNMCLVQSPEAKLGPTIPSVLLFLLHVQQLEIGGFTLANGMFKWTKMRSIARVIDQLRIFKDYYYEFESSPDLEDTIQQRIQDYRECDLHTLASQHEINVTKLPSSGKLPDAFRSLKKKFQGKSDF